MRLCDVTIAVSDEVRNSLLRSPLARRARVQTILNGVDVDSLREAAISAHGVREEFGIAPGRLVVGVVNVFRPQKRLDLWIEAARLIARAEPETTFMVVGDGPMAGEIRAQAERAGLDGRILFPGLRRDAPRLMAAFDVFMLSSVYEGLPVAVLEAMALGRAVVATRVGGLPSVIEDGRHGYLVDPGHPEALAQRVVEFLRRPDLRRRVGAASAERAREKFSIQRMVRDTEDLYERVLAR
jgi:glycosyltransferase involved in cell wall biosynthesis